MPFLRLLKPQPEVNPVKSEKPEIISEPEPQIIKPPENEVHEVNIEDVHEPENVNAPEEISGDSGTVIDSEGDSSNNVIQEEQQVSQEIEQPVEQVQEQEQEEEPDSEAEIISETQEVQEDSQSSDNQQEQETDSEPESESKPESESENTITSELQEVQDNSQGQDITQDSESESEPESEDTITSEPEPVSKPKDDGEFKLQYDVTSGQRYVDLVSTKTEFDKMLDELAKISKELLEHEAERFAKKYTGKFKAEDGKSESEADARKYEAFLGGYISNAAMLLDDKGYRDIALKQLEQAKITLETKKRLEEETAAIHARVEENNDSVDLSDILGMFGDG